MGPGRLQVHVVHEMGDMIPVLHGEDIHLVHDQHLDAGQEVKVPILLLILGAADDHAEPERRGDDHVGGVKVRVQLQGLLGDGQTDFEAVVDIPYKIITKYFAKY